MVEAYDSATIRLMHRSPKYWIGKRKELAGAAYEAHVAEQLRREGWQVDETGRNGINDHGIDLIASKDGVKRYIQCKAWRPTSFIHEDVVSQLYGSVAGIEGTENLEGVEKYIYSSALLDPTAAAEAERLGIGFVRFDSPYVPEASPEEVEQNNQRRNWSRYHPRNFRHMYRRHRHHR